VASSFPLQSLLDHSRHRMEAAERLLRMLKRKEDAARNKLGELAGYKLEYQQRLAGSGAQGLHIHMLRDFHVFLRKLDEAIRLQENEVSQAQAHWESAHANWLALRQKVKAYEALASRHVAAENERQEKREQRVSDEAALRKHQRHSGKTPI
jgi:flagellar FliJ protein